MPELPDYVELVENDSVIIELLNPATGERCFHEEPYYRDKHDGTWLDYNWTEGNFSCDCNRSRVMYPNDEQKHMNCGETIVLVRVTRKSDNYLLRPV